MVLTDCKAVDLLHIAKTIVLSLLPWRGLEGTCNHKEWYVRLPSIVSIKSAMASFKSTPPFHSLTTSKACEEHFNTLLSIVLGTDAGIADKNLYVYLASTSVDAHCSFQRPA